MRAFFRTMNPTLRGFLIILAIVLLVVVLQLQATLGALLIVARIAFLLAIAFFVFLMRREEIANWPGRARIVFYGAALLAVADLGVNWYGGSHGLQILAFVGVLVLSGLAMWRTWRDQHHYA